MVTNRAGQGQGKARAGAGQGKVARVDTGPPDLLAARSNSLLICGPIWTNQMVV